MWIKEWKQTVHSDSVQATQATQPASQPANADQEWKPSVPGQIWYVAREHTCADATRVCCASDSNMPRAPATRLPGKHKSTVLAQLSIACY
jgi:hypothetical protein